MLFIVGEMVGEIQLGKWENALIECWASAKLDSQVAKQASMAHASKSNPRNKPPARSSSRRSLAVRRADQDAEMAGSERERAREILEPGKGRGVEALKDFHRGDLVLQYHGELIDPQEAKEREATYDKDPNSGSKHEGRQHCLDASKETGHLGRLVSHSRKNPNMLVDKGQIRLLLKASKDIQVGEKLAYDYGERSAEALKRLPWLKD